MRKLFLAVIAAMLVVAAPAAAQDERAVPPPHDSKPPAPVVAPEKGPNNDRYGYGVNVGPPTESVSRGEAELLARRQVLEMREQAIIEREQEPVKVELEPGIFVLIAISLAGIFGSVLSIALSLHRKHKS